MSKFVRLPRRVWKLSGDFSRFSSPAYEEIIGRIVREAAISAHRRERARHRPKYFRARVILQCSSKSISLFHNARSGYRAQYYSSIARGERANQFALAALVPQVKRLLQDQAKRTCPWSWMRRSLLDASAKVWIYQGRWLRTNSRRDRKLLVDRWMRAQRTETGSRRMNALRSMLTPASETRIELLGGFMSLDGARLGSLKDSRSKELHELGFT
jgi:hypothetical protein